MLLMNYVLKNEYAITGKKGCPYLVNGKKANFGNLSEAVANEATGNGFHFDMDCVPFDKGSDIETLNMSVKSSGASLACLYREEKSAEAWESLINEYFHRVHSTAWMYVALVDDEWKLFIMNAEEFKQFVREWGTWDKETKKEQVLYKIRLKKTSGKMLRWLEERAG